MNGEKFGAARPSLSDFQPNGWPGRAIDRNERVFFKKFHARTQSRQDAKRGNGCEVFPLCLFATSRLRVLA
jgi:hypothetical protein